MFIMKWRSQRVLNHNAKLYTATGVWVWTEFMVHKSYVHLEEFYVPRPKEFWIEKRISWLYIVNILKICILFPVQFPRYSE